MVFKIILACIFLTGCLSSVKKMHMLKIGMTKEEVFQQLGKPFRVSKELNEEQLFYIFSNYDDPFFINGDEYFVLFNDNGKVISYGKKGDFK